MDNNALFEIRKNVAFLPVLSDRISVLKNKVAEAEMNVSSLLDKYKAESLDVEKLEKNSLSTLLLKNFGRYEDKMEKETEEMYHAKLEYDKAVVRVDELKKDLQESEKQYSAILQEKRQYDAELEKRESAIKLGMYGDIASNYLTLTSELDALLNHLAETEEAYRAATKVISTAGSAISHLDSAEGWATFDVWSKGGIISHMAKYSHVDSAMDDFYRLNIQLEKLGRELRDVDLSGVSGIDGIDSTTRAVDFWFDNIFTDLRVRDRIHEDSSRVTEIRDKVSSIAFKLTNDIVAIKKRIKELNNKKEELLATLEISE